MHLKTFWMKSNHLLTYLTACPKITGTRNKRPTRPMSFNK